MSRDWDSARARSRYSKRERERARARRSSLLQGSFAKETYHFKEPTNRSQTIFKVILNALNMRERETSYLVNHDDQKMRGHSEKKIARKSRNSCRVKCSIECVEHERERNVISGLATVSRVDRIIGLFCRRDLSKRRYSAQQTCNIDFTNRSHPVWEIQSNQCKYHTRKYHTITHINIAYISLSLSLSLFDDLQYVERERESALSLLGSPQISSRVSRE